MKTYKLKENHPTLEKVRRIEDLMRELDVTISFGSNRLFLTDNNSCESYDYVDVESNETGYESPSSFETKLIFEK